MRRCCIAVIFLFDLSTLAAADKINLSTNPPGAGVSTGANTANFSVSGSFTEDPCSGSGPPQCKLPGFVGTFSASGTINYTNGTTLLPFTVTGPGGTGFSGTIQFNQGSFNNTNGSSVPLSQYGANNGLVVLNNTGTFYPASSSTISVTCASGGTLNQPCPGNFSASFTIEANAAATPPAIPIPSTLILVVSGIGVAIWMLRNKPIISPGHRRY